MPVIATSGDFTDSSSRSDFKDSGSRSDFNSTNFDGVWGYNADGDCGDEGDDYYDYDDNDYDHNDYSYDVNDCNDGGCEKRGRLS
jgi:hypothetical protein